MTLKCLLGLLLVSGALVSAYPATAQSSSPTVPARRMAPEADESKEDWGPWTPHLVKSLTDFEPLSTPIPQDRFGGRVDRTDAATGFFHTRQIDGRWWLIDPAGHLFLHNAIAVVNPGSTPHIKAALAARYGTVANWTQAVNEQLRNNGNNGLGAWSDVEHLRSAPSQTEHPLAYVVNLDVMQDFDIRHGGSKETASHHDTISVFDPTFPAFADRYLDRIDRYRSDPNLLGYFSDNELPLWRESLDLYLKRPETDPGRLAASEWMHRHHAHIPTPKLRAAFLQYVAELYFKILAKAIHAHDPNHLYLGCRYVDRQLEYPELFRAAGRYVDAVSLNYYLDWQPSPTAMRAWVEEAHKPFLIAEFYVKGADSGFSNRSGAGWEVHTQADRARFYQNFVLALLASKGCLGWHWFKYRDNDPADPNADPSNLDSNKGIVTMKFEPYTPLLEGMQEFNRHVYDLVDRMDRETHR